MNFVFITSSTLMKQTKSVAETVGLSSSGDAVVCPRGFYRILVVYKAL
jgi:hypothetical protein